MPRFVVQRHHASRLHYDLRLEMDAVLKSWAVPKCPSADTREKRLAVRVEDHSIDYIGFEGEIPEGQYGAGKVEIWDSGDYELIESHEGLLRIRFLGRRMQGPWKLIRMPWKPGENWLLQASHGAQIAGTETGQPPS